MQDTVKQYFTYILIASIILSYFFKSFSLSKMFHAKLPPGSHFRHRISSFCTERHLVANKPNTLMHFICSCTPGTGLALLHNNIMYPSEASIYRCQETTCFQREERYQVTSIEWANKQPAAMLNCAQTIEGCVWVEIITKMFKPIIPCTIIMSSSLSLSLTLSLTYTHRPTHLRLLSLTVWAQSLVMAEAYEEASWLLDPQVIL